MTSRTPEAFAQWLREAGASEELIAATPLQPESKPISDMTTEEIVAALHPCVCNHLTTDHDVRGWCCRYQCPCRTYVDATSKCPNCGSTAYLPEAQACPTCEMAWREG